MLQDELRELAQQDWANMWTSVMYQLRTGVRLKKVPYHRYWVPTDTDNCALPSYLGPFGSSFAMSERF